MHAHIFVAIIAMHYLVCISMWTLTSKHIDIGMSCSLVGQNGKIPLSLKLSSKMSHVWNYLGIYLCFKTRFLENRVSMKNSIFRKSSFNEKLDLPKIELFEKSCMELKFHEGFIFLFILLIFFKFDCLYLDFRQIEFFIETQFLENQV